MLTYLIPTAKEMKIPNQVPALPLSQKSTDTLKIMSQLSLTELAKAYKISEKAAQKEYDRWQALAKGIAPTYPAAQLFNGLMYRYLDRNLLTEQSTVYITSSFYGIIHALEPIAEHRHDFHTKVSVNDQSLKTLWREDYDAFADEQGEIISLLSSEFTDVFSTQIRKKFISVTFMEEKDGQPKTHSTISKKARGAFLTAALKAQAETIDDLKKLSFDGFAYSVELSSPNQLSFLKKLAI